MNRRLLSIEIFLILASLAASIVAYPHLPTEIATHWGMQLQPDGYSDRSAIFWLGPGVLCAVALFTRFGPWLSPTRFNVDCFDATWQRLMFLIFSFLSTVFAIVLWSALGHAFNVSRVLGGAFCLFIVLFANLLGKIRPNFFLGIRTPWTLASERVWIATHRLAAWVVALSGVCGFALVFAGRPQWSPAPFLLAIALSGAYSLLLYKRLPVEGHSVSANE